MGNLFSRALGAARVLRAAFANFIKDEVFHLSAGLSFFGLLSLIPLTVILIAVFGHVLGYSEEMFQQLAQWIHDVLPSVSEAVIAFLRTIIDYRVTGSWTGLIILAIASSMLFTSIERTLDIVLKTKNRRTFFHSHVFSIGMVFLFALLFFIPIAIAAVQSLVQQLGINWEAANLVRGPLFFTAAHALAFIVIVRVVPKEKLAFPHLCRGALLFSCLALFARWMFHQYMVYAFDRYHVIYGSLSALVILVLWLYYLSAVFLYCVEVVKVLKHEAAADK